MALGSGEHIYIITEIPIGFETGLNIAYTTIDLIMLYYVHGEYPPI